MNYYPHHIGDFNGATRHLTRVERSLYRDMIELYYDTEKPLPAGDLPWLCKKVLATTDEEKQAVASILKEFFTLDDGVYRNARCDAEIAVYKARIDSASKAGRASAKRRSHKRNTSVERPLNDRATNQNQNQEPVTKELRTSPKGEVSSASPPPCPHEQIIEAYHKYLPTAPRVVSWTPTRKGYLQARWREDKRRQTLDWWNRFFQYVSESDFLCGRAKPKPGERPFHADLEWLITQGNFVKVVEGKYA